jgi:Ca2+-binding RTX toxin-like protein
LARYDLVGVSPLFLASAIYPGSLADRLLYANATEFGISNSDGSRSYFGGSGFVWDAAMDRFTAGTVALITRYDSGGSLIEKLANLSFPAVDAVDSLRFGFSPQTLFAGADIIDARYRAGNAVVNDILNGLAGSDLILAGSGADMVDGGAGADKLLGGAGNDIIRGDQVHYDRGSDKLYGEDGVDRLYGGGGNDRIDGGAGMDAAIFAGLFADLHIVQTATGFTVTSRDGIDQLAGIERIAADDGIFQFDAATGVWSKYSNKAGTGLIAPESVHVMSNAKDDLRFDEVNSDMVVYLRGGDDYVSFRSFGLAPHEASADVVVFGGTGNDTMQLSTQPNPGSARFYGEDGNDDLRGGFYDDVLNGGAGDDHLFGWIGNDVFTGGSGSDLFYFLTLPNGGAPKGWGNQVITDFELGIDRIDLDEGSASGTPELTQTAEGLLFAYQYDNPTPGAEDATILFRGLHAPGVTVADLTG